MEKSDVKRLIAEADRAYNKKDNWETTWQDQIDFCDPVHDGITNIRSAGEEKGEERLFDDCIIGLGEYTAGLYSALCVGEFTKVLPTNKAILKDTQVSTWWNDAGTTLLSKIEGSNFKNEIVRAFHSLGSIGTAAVGVEYVEKELIFTFFDIMEYAIEENNKGAIDSFYRKMKFTAKQAIQEFGYDKVSQKIQKACERNDNSTQFEFYHIIKPRKSYLKDMTKKEEKPIAQYFIDIASFDIVKEGGFDSMPVAIGRASKSHKEIYGRGSMYRCLATAREFQHDLSTMKSVKDLKAFPNWIVDKQSEVENITSARDEVTYWNSRRSGQIPQREQVNIDLGITFEDINRHRENIMNAFYVPLFDALRDRRNMTATEAQERVSTALLKIAPLSARIVDELLTPLIERSFMLVLAEDILLPDEMKEFDVYPQTKEFPSEINASFYGRLSQIAEQINLGNTTDALNFMLQYAEAFPQMLDYINSDKIPQIGVVSTSAPAELLNSDKEVEGIRGARAEQAEQEQQMAQTSIMADAYSKTGGKPEEGSAAGQLMGAMNE